MTVVLLSVTFAMAQGPTFRKAAPPSTFRPTPEEVRLHVNTLHNQATLKNQQIGEWLSALVKSNSVESRASGDQVFMQVGAVLRDLKNIGDVSKAGTQALSREDRIKIQGQAHGIVVSAREMQKIFLQGHITPRERTTFGFIHLAKELEAAGQQMEDLVSSERP